MAVTWLPLFVLPLYGGPNNGPSAEARQPGSEERQIQPKYGQSFVLGGMTKCAAERWLREEKIHFSGLYCAEILIFIVSECLPIVFWCSGESGVYMCAVK